MQKLLFVRYDGIVTILIKNKTKAATFFGEFQ